MEWVRLADSEHNPSVLVGDLARSLLLKFSRWTLEEDQGPSQLITCAAVKPVECAYGYRGYLMSKLDAF